MLFIVACMFWSQQLTFQRLPSDLLSFAALIVSGALLVTAYFVFHPRSPHGFSGTLRFRRSSVAIQPARDLSALRMAFGMAVMLLAILTTFAPAPPVITARVGYLTIGVFAVALIDLRWFVARSRPVPWRRVTCAHLKPVRGGIDLRLDLYHFGIRWLTAPGPRIRIATSDDDVARLVSYITNAIESAGQGGRVKWAGHR